MRRNTRRRIARRRLKSRAAAQKRRCVIGTIIAVIIIAVAVLLSFGIRWMFKTWAYLTMDELVYHLTTPLEGTNGDLIRDFLWQCVVPAVIILIILIVLLTILKKERKKYLTVLFSGLIISFAAAGFFVQNAWSRLKIGDYIENQGTYSTFVDENYVDPIDVSITFPEKKKNLVYIFLESMEVTYTDKESGGAFDEGCIPDLLKLARENEDFSGTDERLNGALALPGTTWTAAGVFSQTSGIPLTTEAGDNMDTQDTFYENAVTLGDILEKEGYSQTLMLGSDATFGGCRLYLKDHGNFDILDYKYAVENGWIPADYRVWWGYEDKKLFDFAKQRLLELSEGEKPFNLMMQTIDTHMEDGYVCDSCRSEFGENQYANVMACSSRQVVEFVNWIQSQPFGENTSIVLVGDHPTMDSDFCQDVSEDYERRVYTCFVNGGDAQNREKTRVYSAFDIFPTTLASLGVTIEGNRLGLGTNLFSEEETLTEKFGMEQESIELSRKSKLLEELAQFDTEKAKVREQQGFFPGGDVHVSDYDKELAQISIRVDNFRNINNGIQSISAAVWTNDSQDDLQWIDLTKQEDGNYAGAVDVSAFQYTAGDYNIHVYLTDDLGAKYMLGETVKVVGD